jgi:hypothetical protein
MALLMCSPIRPVPPIMRMFCEVVIVDVGDRGMVVVANVCLQGSGLEGWLCSNLSRSCDYHIDSVAINVLMVRSVQIRVVVIGGMSRYIRQAGPRQAQPINGVSQGTPPWMAGLCDSARLASSIQPTSDLLGR